MMAATGTYQCLARPFDKLMTKRVGAGSLAWPMFLYMSSNTGMTFQSMRTMTAVAMTKIAMG